MAVRPVYQGICLGGPNAGKMMAWEQPTYSFNISPSTTALLRPDSTPVAARSAEYYYVPHRGHMGFWLFDEETQGSSPLDDIMRILVEHYSNTLNQD